MGDSATKIRQLLKSDFEQKLFEAALSNLQDKLNKLRYHNFCYSIRELSRHFLHYLSPNDLVLNCPWFKVETENGLPTRAQRIKFAIQGGISDKTLSSLCFDIKEQVEIIKSIKSIIDSLSKYTHINPDNFDIRDAEIEKASDEVLEKFELFVETINRYKEELKKFLDGIIEEDMIDTIISNSYQNIDSLAPHYSLDYGEVTDYRVDRITDIEIAVRVRGLLNVTLEYGTKAERREDDGLDIDSSFPFETEIRYFIEDKFPNQNFDVDEFDVDTSSWYGDDDYWEDEIDRHIEKL